MKTLTDAQYAYALDRFQNEYELTENRASVIWIEPDGTKVAITLDRVLIEARMRMHRDHIARIYLRGIVDEFDKGWQFVPVRALIDAIKHEVFGK